ncbi:hypothetical protein CBR_g31174 [Chara braunii]|uniref:CLASP N-terminal domain-containing protein n=1 Tax=Chara braunii TaxID=69332 RepID=A0A388LEJ0_CHABU|nr:hypothetical protein CBR_g31174 [Chara braunii]|eukprot:GBG80718.1 hypothetical protein CBR_g31174 [Chara braunii]
MEYSCEPRPGLSGRATGNSGASKWNGAGVMSAEVPGPGQSPKPKHNVDRGPLRQVESVRVHSEKELLKEIEKAAAMLVPETDWSVRMNVLQRVQGLVVGGALDFEAFPGMLRQLKDAIASQLHDRRSAIVRQTCQLLNFLAKELRFAFEPMAEFFIPVSPAFALQAVPFHVFELFS